MQLRIYTLFHLLLFLLVLYGIVMAPQISGDRYEIIQERNYLQLADTSPEQVVVAVPARNVTVQIPDVIPVQEEKSMGKGYVAANFHTNVNSPYEMIEDRQHYAASGLFNIHIVHQYSG